MMNRLQKIILAIGVAILLAIILFPHWSLYHPTLPNLRADGSYSFIFSPPRGSLMIPHINFIELVVFVAVAVTLTAIGFWMTRDRE